MIYFLKCEKLIHAYISDVLQSKTRYHSHAFKILNANEDG